MNIIGFETRFEPIPLSGCWIWTGTTRNGYGSIWHDGKPRYAHRVAYELYVRLVSDYAMVLHNCDVRLCVNPQHLYIGSDGDNMGDQLRRGTFPAHLFTTNQTQCKYGHPFSEDNTGRDNRGDRYCKTCNRLRSQAWRDGHEWP